MGLFASFGRVRGAVASVREENIIIQLFSLFIHQDLFTVTLIKN